jgi:hypothetical protein
VSCSYFISCTFLYLIVHNSGTYFISCKFCQTDSHKFSCNFGRAFHNHSPSSTSNILSFPKSSSAKIRLECQMSSQRLLETHTKSWKYRQRPLVSYPTHHRHKITSQTPTTDPFSAFLVQYRKRYLRNTYVNPCGTEGRSTFCCRLLDSSDVSHFSIVLLRQEVFVSWMIAQYFFP